MCIYKQDDKVKSLGWNINSELLQNDLPIAAYHQQQGGGAGTAAALQDLAIPAGLIILKNMVDSNTKFPLNELLEEPKIMGEDLYSKLLGLAGRKNRLSHDTRKKRDKRKNRTRKIK